MSKDKKIEKIHGIKGMNDLLPEASPLWEIVENTIQSVVKSYGYRQVRTPIVEATQLFARGIGEVTDIVEKEMYSFEDSLNGDRLTLRPEGTAGVVRAAIEHNMYMKGQNGCGTQVRCSVMKNHNAVVIASSISLVPKRWVLLARTSTPS